MCRLDYDIQKQNKSNKMSKPKESHDGIVFTTERIVDGHENQNKTVAPRKGVTDKPQGPTPSHRRCPKALAKFKSNPRYFVP